MRALLKEKEPNLSKLMDTSLKKLVDQQQVKDAKVLSLLSKKDSDIQNLQQLCVKHEADYGKLAQSYQEQRRKLQVLEEQEESLNVVVQDLEERLEAA